MEVTDELFDKLAKLSRLKFSDQEKAGIKEDLRKMISFVEKLRELDTDGVEPLIHMSEEVNVFREDIVKPPLTREEVLKNAPVHDGNFFKVPKVIRKT